MSAILKAETPDQVVEALAWAAAGEAPLEVVGRGSKRALGRPSQAAHTLDLAALSGITLYEPDELVLSARAGTPLAEIEAALAECNQMLAFEPSGLGGLAAPVGAAEKPAEDGAAETAAVGSIGGALACNLAGPRRIKAGAARDHFLGFTAVSGRGERFQSGGRVVKNVTGYDLMKLLAGSYGTLAAMTDVTVKVLPRPQKTYSVLVFGLDDGAAVAAMTAALNSPHEVSAAAHLPAAAAARSSVPYVAKAGAAVTALRLEGPGPSVTHRVAALRVQLQAFGVNEELHSVNSLRFWREVRDLELIAAAPGEVLWKVSLPPSQAARMTTGLHAAECLFDWGGGLVWLALPAADDGGAAALRRALAESGGHATLVRAPEELRARIDVFQSQAPALAALTQRIKESFDPLHLLNPGRMYAGV